LREIGWSEQITNDSFEISENEIENIQQRWKEISAERAKYRKSLKEKFETFISKKH